MKQMRRVAIGAIGLAVGVSLAFLAGERAEAYETYHDPTLDDQGYCSACHPGFLDGRNDTLHAFHTAGDDVTGSCNLCHTGSGRDNPIIMWSSNTDDPWGCVGCHGRDYGETIGADVDNGSDTFLISGLSKMSGYGLRKQHLDKGVTLCQTCHTDTTTPVGENIQPPNYARTDVGFGNPRAIDTCTNEDTANDADTVGLDNDGDGCKDLFDSDCGGPIPTTPGETAGPTLTQLIVTGHDATGGTMDLGYQDGCSTTDNTIEYGDLANVSTYVWAGQECGIGSAPYTWTYPGGDIFFVVVGNDGTFEGSYGTDGVGTERPEDKVSATCDIPQNLCGRCD
jgi:hypothetical protein